jgi:hypothetical protein
MNREVFLKGIAPIVDVLGITGDDREKYAQGILKGCSSIQDDEWLEACEKVLKNWRPEYGVKRPVPPVFWEYVRAGRPNNTRGVYRPETRDETLAWCEGQIAKMGRTGIEYSLALDDRMKPPMKLWPECIAALTTRHAELPEEPKKIPAGNMARLLAQMTLQQRKAPDAP